MVDKANMSFTEVIYTTINSEFGMYEGAPSSGSESDHSEDSDISRFVIIYDGGFWYE